MYLNCNCFLKYFSCGFYRSWYVPVNPLEENLGRKLTKVTVSLFSVEVWIHLCMDLFFWSGIACCESPHPIPKMMLGR